jgi:hypothetical protein
MKPVVLEYRTSVVRKASRFLVTWLTDLVLSILLLDRRDAGKGQVVEVYDLTRVVHCLPSTLTLAGIFSEAKWHVFANIRPNIGRHRTVVASLRKRIHLLKLVHIEVITKSQAVTISLSFSRPSIKMCVWHE